MKKSNQYQSSKYAKVTEELFEIEDKFNLFESVIDKTYFWEMIRFDVQGEILSSLGLRGGTQSNSHLNLCIKYGKKIIKNLFVKNPFSVSDHDVLFFTSGRRKKMGYDNYWDIYVDPILESLDLDYIYFEKHGDKHSAPPKTSNIKYLDLIYLDQVGIKLGVPSVGLSRKQKKYIKKIEREIKDRFSVEIDLIEKIKNTIRSRKILLSLYNKILDKIDPNLVIVVTSYGYGIQNI